MIRRFSAIGCVMLASLLLATAAWAHKVNIFAYVEGNRVVTDSGYTRSKRVHGGTVEVYNASTGALLLSGTTDNNGIYDFEIPNAARSAKSDLRLLLKAGAGHQAEWTVKYSEYGAAQGPFAQSGDEHGHKAVSMSDAGKMVSKDGASVDVAAVEAIIKRELEPVKRMLAEQSQSEPGIAEIIGGIGWIFGLLGVAAYMKSRKSSD